MRASGIVAIGLMLAGCTSAPGSVQFSHVHGLAYDAGSGSLFVATHNGLVRGDPHGTSWTWSYVGEKRYDLMGFSADGASNTTFYAGGHPGLLGLASSTDGGVTWASRSYEGKADIHALTGIPGQAGTIVAWWNGMPLIASSDGGRTWTNKASLTVPAETLASSETTLYVGTPGGLLVSTDGGNTLMEGHEPAAGDITAIAASPDDRFVFASVLANDETVHAYRSTDKGATWQTLASALLDGAQYSVVYTFDSRESTHAFAATYGAGIAETRDGGATWTTIKA